MAHSNSAINDRNLPPLKKDASTHMLDDLAELEARIKDLSLQLKNNTKTQPNAEPSSNKTTKKTASPVYHISDLTENLTDINKIVQTLAREDTVRRLAHRWDRFDEQLENIAERQQDKLNKIEPSVLALGERLDNLYILIEKLSSQIDIQNHPLTDRFEKLTQLVAQLIELHLRNNTPNLDPVLNQLDERLAEIQKTFTHTSYKSADITGFNKIEERLTELCTQVSAVLNNQENHDLAAQIEKLNERLDLFNQRNDGSTKQFEKLLEPMGQLAQIATRANNNAREEDLDLINQRFDELLARFDKQAISEAAPAQSAKISNSQSGQTEQNSSTAQIKPEQIVEPVLQALAPRFDQFEASLAQTRESVIETARQTAEQTIARMAENGLIDDQDKVQQLSHSIKALETLTKRTETLNSEAFNNVHETLVKISNRLTDLENNTEAPKKHVLSTDNRKSNKPVFKAPLVEAPIEKKAVRMPVPSEVKAEVIGDEIASTSILAPSLDAAASPAPAMKAPVIKARAASPTMPDINAILRRIRPDQPNSQKAETSKDSAPKTARQFKSSLEANKTPETPEKEISENKNGRQSSLNLVINRHRRSMMVGACILAASVTGYFYFSEIEQKVALLWPAEQLSDQVADLTNIDTDNIVGSVNPATSAQTQPETLTTPSVASPVNTQQKETAQLEENSAPQAASGQPEHKENIVPASSANPVIAPMAMAEPASATAQAQVPALAPTPSIIPEVPEEAGPEALREAAKKGNPDALFEIGNRYLTGQGVASDYAKAANWYQLAADRDHAVAQYRLGNLYEKGSGVERDTLKAQALYEKAALQGNINAMHNLAVIYASNANDPTDNKNAFQWFEKAAELGVLDSQYNLGILNAKAIGTEVNLEEAYKWFALASTNGDADAKEKTQEIAKLLSPEKLERAKALVKLWKPKTPLASANQVAIPAEWTDQNSESHANIDMTKAIRNVQIMLHNAGYNAGHADGIMGNKTREAIMAFQEDNGLAANGEIDESFVKLLLSKNS